MSILSFTKSSSSKSKVGSAVPLLSTKNNANHSNNGNSKDAESPKTTNPPPFKVSAFAYAVYNVHLPDTQRGQAAMYRYRGMVLEPVVIDLDATIKRHGTFALNCNE
ncbi:hypothetical protein BGX34_004032 [Mortierella sp. NVP85]|nr:hypothetical protein BGX34_004032 [Mortierella sp. NVP85]